MRLALLLALAVLAASTPAQAGVRVVPPFDPAEYADRAAVGLLVPGAGPTVTRESALAALLRGELEHDLLGGTTPGEPLHRARRPGEPEILVSLPPPGRSENDRRYPIALLGERGPAHVRLDAARRARLGHRRGAGRLRAVAGGRPGRGAREARRPDRPERPVAAAAHDRARRAPDRARRSSDPGSRCARCSSRSRRTSGSTRSSPSRRVAAVVAAARVSPARRSSRPTSSRWGSTRRRSRSRRSAPPSPAASTGSTTCSRRCCSPPPWSARRCSGGRGVGVAALAFVTIGGNRFGADGGGIVVLAAAYLVLWLRLRGRRPTLRLALGVAAGAVALAARSLLARLEPRHRRDRGRAGRARGRPRRPDRALRAPHGGERRRDRGGPRLARDPGRDRAACPADAVLDAFLVGVAVSLLVNDTPSDVAGMGAAIAIALARHPPLETALHSAPMRRAAALLAVLALALGLAGCGGGEEVSPTPETVIGTLPEETTAETGEDRRRPRRSRATPRTGRASTPPRAAAAATRSRRPDRRARSAPTSTTRSPTFELVVDRVTNGAGAMPAFEGQLSEQEIADVAAYVVENTSG